MLGIILWSAIASAATTVGPTFQLVSQSQMQESFPAISLDDSGGVAIWNDNAARAGHFTAPQPIGNPIRLADSPYRDSAAASIGNESMVAWARNDDIFAQRVAADGNAIGDPIDVAFVDSRHTQRIAMAANHDRYIIIIVIQSRVIAAVLDAQGHVLEYGIPLNSGTYGRNIERVSVTSNGSEFLVVWDASTVEPWTTPCTLACAGEDRDVHAIILNDDGTPRSGTETVLSTGAGDPDVASNGRDYLVTWSRFGGGISAETISAGFTSASDPMMLTTGHDFGSHLAWDGSAYDVAWINADNAPTLMGNRISSSGRIIEPIATGRTFSGFLSRDFDLAARDGKIVFALPVDGHLRVQVLSVTPLPGSRVRAVKH